MFAVNQVLNSLKSILSVGGSSQTASGAQDEPVFSRGLGNFARYLLAALYFLATSLPFFDASAEIRKTLNARQSLNFAGYVDKLKGTPSAQLALIDVRSKSLICLVSDEFCARRILKLEPQSNERLVILPKVSVQRTVGKKLAVITKKNRSLKAFKSGTISGSSILSGNISNISDLIRALTSAGVTLTPLETVLLAVIVQSMNGNQMSPGAVAPVVDRIRGLDPDLAPAQRISEVAYSNKWVLLDGRFSRSGNEIISSGVVSGELLFQNESQLLIKLAAGTGLAQFSVKNSAGSSSTVSINVVAQPSVTPTPVVTGAPVINAIQGLNPAITTPDRLSTTAVSGGQVLLTGSFAASGNEILSTGNVAGTILSQNASQITIQLVSGVGTATFAVKNILGTSQARSITVLAANSTSAPQITKIQGFDSTRPAGSQFSDVATSGREVVLTGSFAASRNELISMGTVGGIITRESVTQINIQLAAGTGQAVFAIKNSSGTSAPAQIAVTSGGAVTAAPVITNIQGYDVKQPADKRRTVDASAGGVVVLTGSFAAKGNQLVSTGNVPATNILLESATEIYVALANVGGTATIAVKNAAGTSASRSITVTGGTTSTTPLIQSINGYMPAANGEMQTSQVAYSGGFVLLSGSFLPSGNTLVPTGLITGSIVIETATQIVVRLSPGAGLAQFAIRNTQGLSPSAFITVVFSDGQSTPVPTGTPAATGTPVTTVTPAATGTPVATVTPAPTVTPAATVTPVATTPAPTTGRAPVITAIAGLDELKEDPSFINISRAKAGTYVILAGTFNASGNEVRSLGTPGVEKIMSSNENGLIVKLAPGTGNASFQVVNANGASNIVSIPVQ